MAKKSKSTATALVPNKKRIVLDQQTVDSFANLTARLGIGSYHDNMSSQNYYDMGPLISRNRLELESMYRTSWLVGQVVDTVAEDMTKDGISMYSGMKPDDITRLQVAFSEFAIWQKICLTIKWARLYGGAVAVMLIDGADYAKPLNIDAIRKDQFKGLVVLDRWMLSSSMGELITDICSDIGKPKYYEVLSGINTFPSQKIHYTRVMRFDGIELPYYQKLFENSWGLSVVERMLDRLMAFDSATQGAAQLLYKAYLRVIGVKGFREALANGGKEEQAVIKQFAYIRQLQSNEGITALDSEDTFNTHTYSFAGVSDMLQQFGQQISGATNIPLVRLFGQSPAGFSATGESDLRNYYDHINKEQETEIRPQLDKLIAVMAKSVLGYGLPEDFTFEFNPLWQISDTEKSTIANTDVGCVAAAFGGGLISKVTALKELKQQSRITGRFTNITEEEIKAAEEEESAPPEMGDLFGEGGEAPVQAEGEAPGPDQNDRMGGQNPDIVPEETDEEDFSEKGSKGTVMDSIRKQYNKQKAFFRDALASLRFRNADVRPALETWVDYISRVAPGIVERRVLTADGFLKNGFLPTQRNVDDFVSQVDRKARQNRAVAAKLRRAVADGEHFTSKEIQELTGKPQLRTMDNAIFVLQNINANAVRYTTDLKTVAGHYQDWLKTFSKDADFEESEHPRDNDGQFTEKGTGVAPKEKKKAATEITYEDLDEKAKEKYQRITKLQKEFSNIWKENEMAINKDDRAACLALIMKTGIRPGNNKDIKAKVKAYGATTLEGRHVVEEDGNVFLRYVGKKGVNLNIPVEDAALAKMLLERKKKAGDSGRIFDTTGDRVLKYSHSLDGGDFKTKDFRTHIGTKTAMETIKGIEPPKNFKEYKKKVMEVAKHVSNKLGNTPVVALQAYIDPRVFMSWRKEIES